MWDIICTLIGVYVDVFILYLYLNIYKIKTSKYIALVIYVLYGFLVLAMNMNEISLVLKLLISLISTIFLSLLLYERVSIFNAIISSIVFFTILGLGEIFIIPYTFISYNVYDIDIFYTDSLTMLWLETFLISRIISLILIKGIERYRIHASVVQSKLEKVITYFPLVVSFSIFIIIEHGLIHIEDSSNEDIIVVMITISILLMFFSILHLKLFESIMKIKRQEIEIIELKYCSELQYKYYEEKIRHDDEIKRLYHDMKNHILMIQEDKKSGRVKYKEKILKELSKYENTVCSGSKVFDILVNAKCNEAEAKGVKFDVLISKSIACINFIDEKDQCSILGNLLDNAIENTIKCENPFVKIRIDIMNNFFIMIIKNTYAPNDLRKNGMFFISSKKDRKNHGIGLESVKYSVEKYDGIVNVMYDQEYFSVKIMIPICKDDQ